MPAQERSPAECADGFVSVLLENKACFFSVFFVYSKHSSCSMHICSGHLLLQGRLFRTAVFSDKLSALLYFSSIFI